jgi:SagB-type dehydrogenase family enzyme
MEAKKMNRRVALWKAVMAVLVLIFIGGVSIEGFSAPPEGSGGQASSTDVVALPSFEKNSPFTLDKALQERRSSRSYDPDKKLSLAEISRLMWAATGVNRPSGGRTVASARGRYPVDVLVALPDGVFLYEPGNHSLKRVIREDIRQVIPTQEGFKKAAMLVLYVINKEKASNMEFADLEIGCIGQNIYLQAAALGLGSCIFAGVAKDPVAKALGLKENQNLRIAQAVGATR